MFPCEYCKISKNTYFEEHLRTAVSVKDSIASCIYLCNVGPQLTNNFYQGNNLYNALSTMLGQHCIAILPSQCFPNTSETALHKINTCAMLAQSPQKCFSQKNNPYKCLDLPVSTLYKSMTCAILTCSPQTTLHRKIICNFVCIYLGQYCIRKLPAECCTMAKRHAVNIYIKGY